MKTNRLISNASPLLMAAVILFSPNANAQESYKLAGASKITVAGTSTMHDWTMTSEEGTYVAAFENNDQGNPSGLSSLVVTIPAKSLKSGKGAMDKNAYAALKTDKFEQITFQLVSAKMNGKTIKCIGNLTIAGANRLFELEALYTLNADHSIHIKGSKEIEMSAFDIEPPSFMFGSVKTGDKISVSFDVTLVPKNNHPITLIN
ncbi:MAG TPA: YceI family protein [Cyclobacteriaceae bacterium]|nr:YceI family protein [Cyclobacteriaceae bacterium]